MHFFIIIIGIGQLKLFHSSGNHCKKVLDNVKSTTRHSIASRRIRSRGFWRISNGNLKMGKSAIPPQLIILLRNFKQIPLLMIAFIHFLNYHQGWTSCIEVTVIHISVLEETFALFISGYCKSTVWTLAYAVSNHAKQIVSKVKY